jgi:N-acetyl-anhydromuramoyl-L-alanine amidase
MMSPPTEAHALWREGWYCHARALASANVGVRPQGAHIDLIVLHAISLPPGQYGGDEVQRFFTNCLNPDEHAYFREIEHLKVSSHFYIRRGGELWQFADCDARAWHAGASQYRGRDQCNDDSIGIELEGLDGDPFEDAQYETLAVLCAAIAQRYPIAHVAGHEHVAPGRKQDPGAGFVWKRMYRALGWPMSAFPQAVRASIGG